MLGFRLTRLAEEDLAGIVAYIIRESGPSRAEAVRRELVRAAVKLSELPGMGHRREDLTDQPVLFWPVYSYLVVYRPETRPLEIVRVVSGWRDVEALLRTSRTS